MSAWIEMVSESEASPELLAAFERARAPDGTVGNVMRVHSLRPHTMDGHVALYNAVLHHDGNRVPEWLQETIGAYCGVLNACDYSFANHFANARHLMGDDAKADRVHEALIARRPEAAFAGKELAFLRYAEKLTLAPGEMRETDIADLRAAGANDGEILEVNQVCAYFNYVHRLLNGLGVTLKGDNVGYYR